jgi:hypothetical protein
MRQQRALRFRLNLLSPFSLSPVFIKINSCVCGIRTTGFAWGRLPLMIRFVNILADGVEGLVEKQCR